MFWNHIKPKVNKVSPGYERVVHVLTFPSHAILRLCNTGCARQDPQLITGVQAHKANHHYCFVLRSDRQHCINKYTASLLGWHLRGLFRLSDSALLRTLDLFAGEPLHSASWSSWWCKLWKFSRETLLTVSLKLHALLQLPFATTWLWNPLWLCPFARKGPEDPFLSIIDLALSMAAGSIV